MLYSNPKNNVQNTKLNVPIDSVIKLFQLESGDGAKFPTTINGTATSTGTSTNLPSTGIGSSGVAVDNIIINLTDKSQAIVTVVAADSITTTPLFGEDSTDRIWQSADEWAVGSFEATINIKDVDGIIQDYENVYVGYVSGDNLHVFVRGYSGTSAKTWNQTTVYVEGFQVSSPIIALTKFIAELEKSKANDDLVLHKAGEQTATGINTFEKAPIVEDDTPTGQQAANANFVLAAIAALAIPYPKSIKIFPATNLAADTVATFNHALGITQADLENGKYKLVLTGTDTLTTGGIQWDSSSTDGGLSGNITGNIWSATATSNARAYWQANDVRIKSTGYAINNAIIQIIQMYA